MDMDQFKKWLEVTQTYQTDGFWSKIFDEKAINQSVNNSKQNPFTKIQDNFPKCDLYKEDHLLVLEAEIPGIKREDLHITIQHQLLTIAGEFKTLQQNRNYFIKERANRIFKKELTLPYPIIAGQVRTDIRDGVLFIVLPLNREEVENIPITFTDEQSN
jgi:HSP20 family protein